MEFPTNEADLAKLVDELIVELKEIQKSEEKDGEKLAKSDEGSALPPDEEPAPSPSAESAPPSPSASAEVAPPEAPPADDAPPAPSAEAAPEAPAADPAMDPAMADQDAPPSVEEIASMYEQLPPDQLEVHAKALEMAKAKLGMGAPEAPAPEAPVAAPPAAPAMDEMAMKSEARIAALEAKLAKAEEKLASADKAEETAKQITGVLEMIVGRPERKAVNGINFFKRAAPSPEEKPLKKSAGEMTKAELDARLKEVVAGSKLSKSDRDLINEHYFRPGSVSLDSLDRIINPSK